MDLGDVRTVVTYKIGEDAESSGTFQTLVDSWANEAVRDILLRTHLFVDVGTMDTIADTGDYDLPDALGSGIIAIEELQIQDADGNISWIDRVSPDRIMRWREGLDVANATLPRYYSIQGANMLNLYPTPDAVYTLQFHFIPKPNEANAAGHDFSDELFGGLPHEYHKAIEYYVLWQASDLMDDIGGAHGERYHALYEEFLNRAHLGRNLKGGRRLPPILVGPASTRRSGIKSRDVYP